jgi:hypothetical protein
MALGIGYILGRRHRFRTAAMMGAAMAVGGTGVGPVARRAVKTVGSPDLLGKLSPEIGEIVDTVRGDLITAVKGAAAAAVISRVDSLTDSIHERAERVRNPGETVAEGAEQATATAGRAADAGKETAGRAASSAGRAVPRPRGREAPDERDDYEPDEPADDYEDTEDYEAEDTEPDDTSEREERPAPVRRTSARRRSPVTRSGR